MSRLIGLGGVFVGVLCGCTVVAADSNFGKASGADGGTTASTGDTAHATDSPQSTSVAEYQDSSGSESGSTGTTEPSESSGVVRMTDPLSSCGDGVIYGSEDCDGTNLSGNECTTLGFIDGVLSCDPITCQFDTSECHSCGNAAVDDPEECDGADLGGSSCIELSFGGGQLACNSSCAFDTSGCIPCDAPSNPPGDATCPDACDTCVGNVCVINCGADECEDLTMQCPADFNCEIHCVGNDACRNGAIGCPAEADCSIECAGDEACENTSIDCGAGLCSLECDATNQSCRNTDLTCGDRECAATCGGASNNYPSVSCGNACSCTPCGA